MTKQTELAKSVGVVAEAARDVAKRMLMDLETGVTDVFVITVALIRNEQGVATYVAGNYDGCPACISRHSGQMAIDVISTGFIEMTQAGHSDVAHP